VNISLNYRQSSPPAATVTLTQVLQNQFDANAIKGKIVLIGTTAEASKIIR
jgi:CHASE2 domain-containing sensor protein